MPCLTAAGGIDFTHGTCWLTADLDEALEAAENHLLTIRTGPEGTEEATGAEGAEGAAARPGSAAAPSGLAGLPGFDDPELLYRLHELLERVELAAGACLFRAGDPVDGLYLLESGRIALRTAGPGARTGRLACLTAGAVIGEEPLCAADVRAATAVAELPCVAWRLSPEALLMIETGNPALTARLHLALTRRLARQLRQAWSAMTVLHDAGA